MKLRQDEIQWLAWENMAWSNSRVKTKIQQPGDHWRIWFPLDWLVETVLTALVGEFVEE